MPPLPCPAHPPDRRTRHGTAHPAAPAAPDPNWDCFASAGTDGSRDSMKTLDNSRGWYAWAG
ncbi:hypothetical protein OOK41_15435 [Micromonospora sp. NBC_01655]|uniref:hypothetical protein n=1 Tax=Micromonospora sp. NBC_01655 TaxID=2975983 RepID=UPI00225C2797|nr:hypothetical protein [Micromonospora sp. NBC_01655]MCX4471678.1 hypothetical protein [Micromonospora sp. NBC_01655]